LTGRQLTGLRMSGDMSAYQYAQIHAQRGEVADALHWLEVARRVHDPRVNQA
jgi:hypothetical protein